MKHSKTWLALAFLLLGLAAPALAGPTGHSLSAPKLQEGAASGSFGDPGDMYLEFSISGGDLKLREGTPSSYEGPWNGGAIQFSGNMVVNRSGGAMSYVTMSANLADQSLQWPGEGEDGRVEGRSVSQPFSFTFDVPTDYAGSSVTGSARVEACGGVCGVYAVDFRIDLPTPPAAELPPVPTEEPSATPNRSLEAPEYRLSIQPGDRDDPLQFSMSLEKREPAGSEAVFQPVPGARLKVQALAYAGNDQRLAEEFVAPACQNCEWRETGRYRLGHLPDPKQPIELLTDGSGRAGLVLFLDFARLGNGVPDKLRPLQIPIAVEAWAADAQGAETVVAQGQQAASVDAIGVITAITFVQAQMFDDFGNALPRDGGPLSLYTSDPGTRDGPNTLQRVDRVLYEAADYASLTAPGSTPGRALEEGDLIRAGDKVVINACDMVTNLIRDGLPAGAPGVIWVHLRFFDGLRAKAGVNGSVCRETIQFGRSPDEAAVGGFHYWWAKKGVSTVVGHYIWPYKILSALPTAGNFLAWVWGNEAAGYETVYVKVQSALVVEFDEAGAMHLTTREGEPVIYTRSTGDEGVAVPPGQTARVADGLSVEVQATGPEAAAQADAALADLELPPPYSAAQPASPATLEPGPFGELVTAGNLAGLGVCLCGGVLAILLVAGVGVVFWSRRRRKSRSQPAMLPAAVGQPEPAANPHGSAHAISCPACGAATSPASRACSACGASLGPAPWPATAQPSGWQLVAVAGDDVGRRYTLGTVARLGRQPGNDIQVAEDSASRQHALIQRQGEHYVLSDLSSRNGTYLNGHRLDRPAALRDGDAITIGGTTLRIEEAQYESAYRAPAYEPPAPPTMEPVLGVVSGLVRRKGLASVQAYTLILTPYRLIFARLTSEMQKDAASQAKQAAQARGEGFFGQWGAAAQANAYAAERYRRLPVDAIVSEHPDNFFVSSQQVRKVEVRQGNWRSDQPDPDELIIHAAEKMRFWLKGTPAPEARNLLVQVLGSAVR